MNITDVVEVRFVGKGAATLLGVVEYAGQMVTIRFGKGSQSWCLNVHRDRFWKAEDGRWRLELS